MNLLNRNIWGTNQTPLSSFRLGGSDAVFVSKWVQILTQRSFYTTSVRIGVSETEIKLQTNWNKWGCQKEKTFRESPHEHPHMLLRCKEHPSSLCHTYNKPKLIQCCPPLTSQGIQSSSSCPSCWSCPCSLSSLPCPPVGPCVPDGTRST